MNRQVESQGVSTSRLGNLSIPRTHALSGALADTTTNYCYYYYYYYYYFYYYYYHYYYYYYYYYYSS